MNDRMKKNIAPGCAKHAIPTPIHIPATAMPVPIFMDYSFSLVALGYGPKQ